MKTLFVAIACMLFFSGCSGNPKPEGSTQAEPSVQTVEVVPVISQKLGYPYRT
jgi:PBP1b-binding outer membrane lipoprotein LpoB